MHTFSKGMRPLQLRSQAQYSFDFPKETSVEEEIDNAQREGERLTDAVYRYRMNDASQGIDKMNENLGINTNEDYMKDFGEGINEGLSKGFFIPPVEDYRQRSDNHLDFEKGMNIQRNSGRLNGFQMDGFDKDDEGQDIEVEGSVAGNDKPYEKNGEDVEDRKENNVLHTSGGHDDYDVLTSSGDDDHEESISGDFTEDHFMENKLKDKGSIKPDENGAQSVAKYTHSDNPPSKSLQEKTIFDHIQFEINKKLKERDQSLSKVLQREKQHQKGS